MSKKIILWIVWILAVLWVSNAQTLTLSTEWDGTFWYGCLVPVDVYVDTNWEEISAMDLIIKSSMDYKDFENTNIFPYYFSPVKNWEWLIHIVWFTVDPSERFIWTGKIWTLYFQHNNSDIDAAIKLLFLWEWELLDNNLSIAWWIDVLKNVEDLYIKFSSDLPTCDDTSVQGMLSSIDWFSDKTFDDVLNDTMSKINSKYPEHNNIIWWMNNNMCAILLGILIILVFVVIYKVLSNKRHALKWNM